MFQLFGIIGVLVGVVQIIFGGLVWLEAPTSVQQIAAILLFSTGVMEVLLGGVCYKVAELEWMVEQRRKRKQPVRRWEKSSG